MNKLIINFPHAAPRIHVATTNESNEVLHRIMVIPRQVIDNHVTVDVDELGDMQFRKMTPDEFDEAMSRIRRESGDDRPLALRQMTRLVAQILRDQGFSNGAYTFENYVGR